jgi:hypothetical protein
MLIHDWILRENFPRPICAPPPQTVEKKPIGALIYYNNERFQTEKVHHSRKLLHNHPTNQPRTNSRLKAPICPILPIQLPSSNSSSSSRKFLREKVLSREYHVLGPTRDMSMSFGIFPTLETSAASDLIRGMKLCICNCETLDVSIRTEDVFKAGRSPR